MHRFRIILISILLIGFSAPFTSVFAQKDSIVRMPRPLPRAAMIDTLRVDSSATVDTSGRKKWGRPQKALVIGLVVPGGGQIYNKKYWKLPILYAGIGAAAYFWIKNQQGFLEFQSEYNSNYVIQELDPTAEFVYYSSRTNYTYTSINQLSSQRDTYRRYRDFAIVGSLAFYAISLIDAYVDAHLSTFDLSPDLSMSVQPLLYPQNNTTFVAGLSLGFKLKNNRVQQNQLLKRSF